MKREGQLWIKIFPDKPITKKPLEVRMGKGKGAVEYNAVVKPGRIMFEVGGVPCQLQKRRYVLRLKAPVKKTKLLEISKHNLYYIMKQSEIKDLSAAELQEKL
jgi:large subunit ribosomal protein L16